MSSFDSQSFLIDAFDSEDWDIDGAIVNPVMPQTDNAGTGGIGRMPKRYTHTAVIEFDFSFDFEHEIERDWIDDELIGSLMLLLAEV